MLAKLFAVVLFVGSVTVAHSQEVAAASDPSFLDYLKPGMHIGVQSVEGTTDVLIHVYTERNFETAGMIVKLRSIPLASELAETNEVIREELAAFIERNELTDSEIESVRLFPLTRTSLATVRVIGGDFILVELQGDTTPRKIIPKSKVGAIHLDATPLRFYNGASRATGYIGG